MCKCLLVYKCRRLWWWINVKIYTNITFPKSIIINYQTSNVVACVFLFGADALFLLKAAGADGLFCFEQRSVQMDILFLNSGQCRWTFCFWTAVSADGHFVFEQRSVQMDYFVLNSGQCRWTFLFGNSGQYRWTFLFLNSGQCRWSLFFINSQRCRWTQKKI